MLSIWNQVHENWAPQQDVARCVLLLSAEGAEPASACGIPALLTLRDPLLAYPLKILGGASSVACPQLVDVHREEAIQADHGWRHRRVHQVAEPLLGPLACGPGSRHPGYRPMHGAGIHRYVVLREAGRHLGQDVRLLITLEVAV